MSTEVYVVAFDPGETIGYCLMGVPIINLTDVNTRTLDDAIHTCGIWQWGQIDSHALGSNAAGIGAHRGHDALNLPGENNAVMNMLAMTTTGLGRYAAIALEKFVLDPKLANSKYDLLSPVRIISAFSMALHMKHVLDTPIDRPPFPPDTRNPLERFYLINRGDPKRTCNNERMKHWGFGAVVSHRNRHACDASRIAYYFLRDCRGSSQAAQEARWRAWPHIFNDPAVSHRVSTRRRPTKPTLGERI